MKTIEEHLENVEREHEKEISNFIDHRESQKILSTSSTIFRADLTFDENTVKSTLEELSNRMIVNIFFSIKNTNEKILYFLI